MISDALLVRSGDEVSRKQMHELEPPYPLAPFVEKDDHLVYVKAEGLCFGCRKTLCKNRSELVYSCTSYQPRITRGSR